MCVIWENEYKALSLLIKQQSQTVHSVTPCPVHFHPLCSVQTTASCPVYIQTSCPGQTAASYPTTLGPVHTGESCPVHAAANLIHWDPLCSVHTALTCPVHTGIPRCCRVFAISKLIFTNLFAMMESNGVSIPFSFFVFFLLSPSGSNCVFVEVVAWKWAP